MADIKIGGITINTQDKRVKEALMAAGWNPPVSDKITEDCQEKLPIRNNESTRLKSGIRPTGYYDKYNSAGERICYPPLQYNTHNEAGELLIQNPWG